MFQLKPDPQPANSLDLTIGISFWRNDATNTWKLNNFLVLHIISNVAKKSQFAAIQSEIFQNPDGWANFEVRFGFCAINHFRKDFKSSNNFYDPPFIDLLFIEILASSRP